MLSCFSSDLSATWKVCGFASHSAQMGCSKCLKKFKAGSFGDKLDYSGYERDNWEYCNHSTHLAQLAEIKNTMTITERKKLEMNWDVRNSELL